jgi:hypothetical protein
MLAKLRTGPSQRKAVAAPVKKQVAVATVEEISKPSAQELRQSRLRKKKVPEVAAKRVSAPIFVTEFDSAPSPVGPPVSDPIVPFGVYESEFRFAFETRTEDESPAPVGVTPDRTTLPITDLRRDDSTVSSTAAFPSRQATTQPHLEATSSRNETTVHTHPVHNVRRSVSDVPCSRSPRKLVKKHPPEDPTMSPLSALKRRFSCGPSSPGKIESELSEEDLKRLSITATRRPEFSSESAEQSQLVQVVIVDHLPHQQSSPRLPLSRRHSSLPSTIPETDLNEDLLDEQEEVLSYLHSTLFLSPAEPSPKTATSDGGLPQTPPSTLPKRNPSFTSSSASFVGSIKSEFPYLLGEQNDIIETSPLYPRSAPLYGLGLAPASANMSRFNAAKFPPSPPQSVGRGSADETHFILDELASESRSMKSVVDAINNACTPRTSFDYTDDGSVYEFDDTESYILPSNQQLPFSSQRDDLLKESFRQDDNDSIYSFAAPILRNGRFHQSPLSRSSSQSTEFETTNQGAAKSHKPQLPPLITTSISNGNYGPSLKRRSHVRGRRSISSPISATVHPTLVKVVEEEMVEYTPIEDNKGWMRQRRISRDGQWVVVEREILEKGVI